MSDSEAYVDALERAKQVVSKFSTPDEGQLNGSFTGAKRPAGDTNDYTGAEKRPFVKDAAAAAAEAAAKISQKISGGAPTSPVSQNFARPITTEISIPDRFVGLVIGRKGEQIIKIQGDSNCKVQIAPEGGNPERTVTLTGTPQQVQSAKSMLTDLIDRADKTSFSGSTPTKPSSTMYDSTPYQQNGPMATVEIMIPGPKAGLIIGKSGERIKRLQEENGVKMVLIQESSAPTMQDKPLHISGEASRVEKVKAQILELISHAGAGGYGDSSEVTRYAVPVEKAGLVIGKGGDTIKEICRVSGAVVHLSKDPAPDTSIKIFNIRGNRNETEQAIRMISERAGIPITAPATGAAISGAWGQYGYQADPWSAGSVAAVAGAGVAAPSYNPYTGQPDYSAAWIEYYRRQGMHEYADMIQRQSQQQGGPAQVQAQNGPVAPMSSVPMSHQAPQQALAPQQQQQVAPMAQAAPGYGAAVPGQPSAQQCDYGQWQQWQQWQAYQQAYQQQQPAMGHPMSGGPGYQQSAGMPQSVPMGGGMQHQQPQ